MIEKININIDPSEFTDEELSNLANVLDEIGDHSDAQEVETYILNRKSSKDDPEFDFEA